jgi:hypothetical protein
LRLRRTAALDPGDDKLTGADIIAFVEAVCFIPEGGFVGKPLQSVRVAEG